MPVPTAIPFNKSTAEIMTPRFPVFSANAFRAGLVPAPQNHAEFAGLSPISFLFKLIG